MDKDRKEFKEKQEKKLLDACTDVNQLNSLKQEFLLNIQKGSLLYIEPLVNVVKQVLKKTSYTAAIKYNILMFLKEAMDTRDKELAKYCSKKILPRLKEIAKNSLKPDKDKLFKAVDRTMIDDFYLLLIECFQQWQIYFQIEPGTGKEPSQYKLACSQLLEAGIRFPSQPKFFKKIERKVSEQEPSPAKSKQDKKKQTQQQQPQQQQPQQQKKAPKKSVYDEIVTWRTAMVQYLNIILETLTNGDNDEVTIKEFGQDLNKLSLQINEQMMSEYYNGDKQSEELGSDIWLLQDLSNSFIQDLNGLTKKTIKIAVIQKKYISEIKQTLQSLQFETGQQQKVEITAQQKVEITPQQKVEIRPQVKEQPPKPDPVPSFQEQQLQYQAKPEENDNPFFFSAVANYDPTPYVPPPMDSELPVAPQQQNPKPTFQQSTVAKVQQPETTFQQFAAPEFPSEPVVEDKKQIHVVENFQLEEQQPQWGGEWTAAPKEAAPPQFDFPTTTPQPQWEMPAQNWNTQWAKEEEPPKIQRKKSSRKLDNSQSEYKSPDGEGGFSNIFDYKLGDLGDFDNEINLENMVGSMNQSQGSSNTITKAFEDKVITKQVSKVDPDNQQSKANKIIKDDLNDFLGSVKGPEQLPKGLEYENRKKSSQIETQIDQPQKDDLEEYIEQPFKLQKINDRKSTNTKQEFFPDFPKEYEFKEQNSEIIPKDQFEVNSFNKFDTQFQTFNESNKQDNQFFFDPASDVNNFATFDKQFPEQPQARATTHQFGNFDIGDQAQYKIKSLDYYQLDPISFEPQQSYRKPFDYQPKNTNIDKDTQDVLEQNQLLIEENNYLKQEFKEFKQYEVKLSAQYKQLDKLLITLNSEHTNLKQRFANLELEYIKCSKERNDQGSQIEQLLLKQNEFMENEIKLQNKLDKINKSFSQIKFDHLCPVQQFLKQFLNIPTQVTERYTVVKQLYKQPLNNRETITYDMTSYMDIYRSCAQLFACQLDNFKYAALMQRAVIYEDKYIQIGLITNLNNSEVQMSIHLINKQQTNLSVQQLNLKAMSLTLVTKLSNSITLGKRQKYTIQANVSYNDSLDVPKLTFTIGNSNYSILIPITQNKFFVTELNDEITIRQKWAKHKETNMIMTYNLEKPNGKLISQLKDFQRYFPNLKASNNSLLMAVQLESYELLVRISQKKCFKIKIQSSILIKQKAHQILELFAFLFIQD